MSSFIAKIAGAALFAVAALPAVALTMAHAEPSAVVRVSDLDLSKAGDARTFNSRVEHAATEICSSYSSPISLTQQAACKTAVRVASR